MSAGAPHAPGAPRGGHSRGQADLARLAGPATVILLLAAYAVLWIVRWPSGDVGGVLGQFLGALGVLCLSLALVLITTLRWVDRWFDGIDRAAIWHRRLAIAGILLVAIHPLIASDDGGSALLPSWEGLSGPLATISLIGLAALGVWSVLPRWRSVLPRPGRALVQQALATTPGRLVQRHWGGYDRWRLVHRTTGLFLLAGALHGLIVGTMFGDPVLRWTYVGICVVGLGFYAYRETVAKLVHSLHDYTVRAVTPIADDLTEITLAPLGPAMRFTPGQFATIYLEARDGWHRHPFSIASAPDEGVIRVAVKALGDYTGQIADLVGPGMPAVIGGPYGRFDRRRGTRRQIWIGAGVGVAPFLSWVRALDDGFDDEVDFYYCATEPAPFADEILAIAAHHPTLRVHLVVSPRDPRLTPDDVLPALEDPHGATVFMCGPKPMLRQFAGAFRAAGVRRSRILHEHFDWR